MPKIHSIRQNNVNESKSSSFLAGWSQSRTPEVNSLTIHKPDNPEAFVCRPPLVKQFFSGALKTWLPMSLHPDMLGHASPDPEAAPEVGEVRSDGQAPVDIRPHIFDPVLKQFLLCDSGSQVSAFPPDPGDQPLKNAFLKAANGSRMDCYGHKEVRVYSSAS